MNGFYQDEHNEKAIQEARQKYKGMHNGTVRGKPFEQSRRNRKRVMSYFLKET